MFPIAELYLQNLGCREYIWNTYGEPLKTRYFILLTVFITTNVPFLAASMIYLPFDAVYLLFYEFIGIPITIFNPLFGILFLFLLFVNYQISLVMGLVTILPFYLSNTTKFWLRYAIQSVTDEEQCKCGTHIGPSKRFMVKSYKMMELHFVYFNECYGTLSTAAHHLIAYFCFIFVLFCLIRGGFGVMLNFLCLVLVATFLSTEWSESHFTDVNDECHILRNRFISRRKFPLRHLKLTVLTLSTLKMQLGGRMFQVRKRFVLYFLHFGLNHLITLLLYW